MFTVRLAGGHLYGKQLFTWLSLVVSLMASFVLSFFPLDVLDEIWDLIESVSEGFLTYSSMAIFFSCMKKKSRMNLYSCILMLRHLKDMVHVFRTIVFGRFPKKKCKLNITFLELYPTVIALETWCHL